MVVEGRDRLHTKKWPCAGRRDRLAVLSEAVALHFQAAGNR